MGLEYRRLPTDDDDRLSGSVSDQYEGNCAGRHFQAWNGNLIWVVSHVLIAATTILLVFLSTRSINGQSPGLNPLELELAANAIEYETIIFAPSGFGEGGRPVTPYEGPPTPEKDRLWHDLVNVGVYALTKSQNEDLRFPTEESPDKAGEYIVQIEMFHQIHCLNYIRKKIYSPESKDPAGEKSDMIHIGQPLQISHISLDPSINFLQHLNMDIDVLMCHGDVTPLTMFYREGKYRNFWPNFTIPHTCRKFDKIYEWAAQGNTSGHTIE